MIRDDEIKRRGCSRLLSGWRLWKKKKSRTGFFSGMGWQTSAPETCQLRCRSTQRRPNSANHRHKFAVLSSTTRAEMEGWFQTWLQEGGAAAMAVLVTAELNLAVGGGGGSLAGVYSSTWRGLSLRLWNRRRLVLFFCAEQFTQPLASALTSPRSWAMRASQDV